MNFFDPTLDPDGGIEQTLNQPSTAQAGANPVLSPEAAARAKRQAERQAAAQAERQAAMESPESLVLYKCEQSLAPYARALQSAQAQMDRFGVLGKLRGGDEFERARTRLELARSAYWKADAFLEDRQPQMLESARRLFEARAKSSLPMPKPLPAVNGIELDPRHQRQPRPSQSIGG